MMKGFSVPRQKQEGSTTIELLVSLAIIAMLFGVVMALLSGVKEKSRDARRMSNVQEISKALVLYSDNNGIFPISVIPTTITGSDVVSTLLENNGVIPQMPVDPIHPINSYTYSTDAAGRTFTISFCLETNTIPNYSQGCGNTVTQ